MFSINPVPVRKEILLNIFVFLVKLICPSAVKENHRLVLPTDSPDTNLCSLTSIEGNGDIWAGQKLWQAPTTELSC